MKTLFEIMTHGFYEITVFVWTPAVRFGRKHPFAFSFGCTLFVFFLMILNTELGKLE